MSSYSKTAVAGLNQWQGSDHLAMEDFNADRTALDEHIKQRMSRMWRVGLKAGEWSRTGAIYRQQMGIPTADGDRVDLTAAVPDLVVLNAPVVAVNIDGTTYAQTTYPPTVDVAVQVTVVHTEEATG